MNIFTFLRAGGAADGADESVEFCWIQTTRTRAFEEPQVSNKKKQLVRTCTRIYLFLLFISVHVHMSFGVTR
jgi:hypothetical protein